MCQRSAEPCPGDDDDDDDDDDDGMLYVYYHELMTGSCPYH